MILKLCRTLNTYITLLNKMAFEVFAEDQLSWTDFTLSVRLVKKFL